MKKVVDLGAWCDLVTPGESTASAGGISFDVHEFATLSDGRRLTLDTGRGFTTFPHAADGPSVDPWTLITRESVESGVRSVIQPDDESKDEHPYEWLSQLLRRQGVEASAERLRRVPYRIEFSDRLERRLPAQPLPDGG